MNGKGQRYKKLKIEVKDRERNQHSQERLIQRESEGRARLSRRKASWFWQKRLPLKKPPAIDYVWWNFGTPRRRKRDYTIPEKNKNKEKVAAWIMTVQRKRTTRIDVFAQSFDHSYLPIYLSLFLSELFMWKVGRSKIWQTGDPGKSCSLSPNVVWWQDFFLFQGRQSLFHSALQLIGWGPPTLVGGSNSLYPESDLNVNVIQNKHFHRNIQNNVWPNIWAPWPRNLTHKINHYSCLPRNWTPTGVRLII